MRKKPIAEKLDISIPALTVGGKTVTALNLVEPLSKHVQTAGLLLVPGHSHADRRQWQFRLVSQVTGIPEEDVQKIPVSRLDRASAYLWEWIDKDAYQFKFDADSHVITLKKPVVLENAQCERLSLREPFGGEVLTAERRLRPPNGSGQARDYEIALVALVSGVQEPLIRNVPISQLNEAVAFFAHFFDDGQEAGDA
jgi:hypothetical protein